MVKVAKKLWIIHHFIHRSVPEVYLSIYGVILLSRQEKDDFQEIFPQQLLYIIN